MSISLSVNGTPYSITPQSNGDPFYSPTTTLLDFIRVKTPYKATKHCCGEGGCGCCVVSLTQIDNVTGNPVTRPVNACLALLFSLDGAAVTTNEGTGSSVLGYSNIQKALAANNAFQCSFCTSGKNNLLATYLVENPNATPKELQDILDGSLCRCAAYPGILQTYAQFGKKSYDEDGSQEDPNALTQCMKENCCQKRQRIDKVHGLDVEECTKPLSWDEVDKGLVTKHFQRKSKKSFNGTSTVKNRTLITASNDDDDEDDRQQQQQQQRADPTLPPSYSHALTISSQLRASEQCNNSVHATSSPDVPYLWQDCDSLADLAAYWALYQGQKVQIIKNATSFGIFHDYRMGEFNVFLHLTDNIVEMQGASIIQGAAKVGANCTIKDCIEFLNANSTTVAGAQNIFPAIAKHFGRIAGTSIRNRATIGGNLSLCKHHSTMGDSFPSDAAIALLGAQAQLIVFDLNTQGQKIINLSDYYFNGSSLLSSSSSTRVYDANTTIILQVLIPLVPAGNSNTLVFKTYKIAARQVMDHAIVNAAFSAQLSRDDGKIASFVCAIGGCFPAPSRVTVVEQMLVGASPMDLSALQSACHALAQSISGGLDPSEGRVQFRIRVAQNYLYKFFLALQGSSLSPALVQASQQWMTRDRVQVSNQTHGSGNPALTPVGLAMPKLDALTLAAGEAMFSGDNTVSTSGLFAAPVLTTQAKSPITSINKRAGAVVPGFVQYFDKNDAPSNSFLVGPLELFAGDFSNYSGQLVGVAVAESQAAARLAAKKIQQSITYGTPTGPLVLTPDDCVAAKSYFTPGTPNFALRQGDAAAAMMAAARTVRGSLYVGSQYHLHLENHVATVTPTENGYDVDCCSQCVSSARDQVAETVQVCASSVFVTCRRCGGGFGAKVTGSMYCAAATAVAARALRRPVKCDLLMQQGAEGLGARSPYRLDYEMGVDAHNKIVALTATMYIAAGFACGDVNFEPIVAVPSLDNCYQIPNADVTCWIMKSDAPPNTSVRGPGWVSAQIFAEQMMNSAARKFGLDPVEFRNLNFHKAGDLTFSNLPIESSGLSQVWTPLQAIYQSARATAQQLNAKNRFYKRGVGLGPIRFPVTWTDVSFQAMVAIYPDASVGITTGGAEIGQGLWTKVTQVAAYGLGLSADDLPTMRVFPNNTAFVSTGNQTGGSISSETCALAVLHVCQELNKRLAPFRKEGQKWADLVTAATGACVDLTARETSGVASTAPFRYNTYGAACAQVDVDGLTGQFELRQVDIYFDVGQSMNPDIDLGQVAGGFTMGLGLVTLEDVALDPKTGKALNATTWKYKPPTAFEVPETFNINLLPNAHNRVGVLSSKACGEPPMAMSMAVVSAIEDAVNQVRADFGNQTPWACTRTPLTVDVIANACAIPNSAFVLA